MKKLPLFTLLFTTFALSISLPKLGFSLDIPSLFENMSLTRNFASASYLYVFDFDFVNPLSQPIEIISVSVFDMNENKVEQDWEASGPNWDRRLMTHALSGDHPLVKIISKPRGTPLEQATVSPVGDRIEITVTNRVLSAGEAIRPSLYLLSSKNKYDSLVLRVAYRLNGSLQVVSHTFTVGMREEEWTASPKAQVCTFSETATNNDINGTLYAIHDEGGVRYRSDIALNSPQNHTQIELHLIIDSTIAYIWGNTNNGFITTVDEKSVADIRRHVLDSKCRDWTPDNTVFEPPTNISFTSDKPEGEPLNVPNPGAYKIAQAITNVWKKFNEFASSDSRPTSLTDGIIAAGCLAGTAIVAVTKGYLPVGLVFEIQCVKSFQDIVTSHCGGGDPYTCFITYMIDHPGETLNIVKDILPGDIPP